MQELALTISNALIAVACAVQVANAVRFFRFFVGQRDAASGQRPVDRKLGNTVGVLLLFFIPVYVYMFYLSIPNVWVGALLFSSAVFVYSVLEWILSLMGSVRQSMLDLSQTLVGVMEASDPNLNGHSRHVQNLALLLYDHLPADLRAGIDRNDLSYAALFHDIGKLGISDFILQKPGKLTADEMNLVRDHPRIGAEILSSVESFRGLSKWVLYHHERVDGHGYYSVAGSEVPLAAKLLAVVDTYSAVTMRRSYKNPATYEKGIAVLREAAGTQLDATLVDIFCSIPHTDVLACAPATIEIVGGASHMDLDDQR